MKKIGRLDRPDNFGSATLFSNPVLERISRTHISIPISLFLAISSVSFYYGVASTTIPLGLGLAFFALGIAIQRPRGTPRLPQGQGPPGHASLC